MAEIVRMPKMSDTMEEGVIVKWHKKVGEAVKTGELLAEIETDKATMDYESYNEGVVLYRGAGEGEPVKVDSVLAIVGKKGEDVSALLSDRKDDKIDAPAEEKKASSSPTEPPKVNAELILMPKMSDTMTEGVLAKWHKETGEEVKSGDLLAEIETDKATMDYESYHTGVLLYKGTDEGNAIPVDGVLSIIGEKGADWKSLLEFHEQSSAASTAQNDIPKNDTPKNDASSPVAEPAEPDAPKASGASTQNGRIKASPLAKKIAREKGYDIAKINGSGDGGRVIKRDVENYRPEAMAPAEASPVLPPFVGEEQSHDEPLSQTRKTIARRLSESKFSAPHFYLTMEINMDKVIEARKSINEIAPVKVSFNDLVVKAVAAALRQRPEVNVSWQKDAIRKNQHIHIGIAVAIDEGLVVPVVRFADNKPLARIAIEIKEAAKKAQAKKLQPDDFEGSTFTISNLGMFGIEEFTAIINPPNACILAVGGIKETAIVKDGKLVAGHVMKVTLSCDHRAVDGAVGAAFLKTLKTLLEDPVRILV